MESPLFPDRNYGLESHPFFEAIPKTEMETVKGIDVLRDFPGFENFFENTIKPAIINNPDRVVIVAVLGEAGISKETKLAMFKKFLDESPSLKAWQKEQGLKLGTTYVSRFFGEKLKSAAYVDPGSGLTRFLVDSVKEPDQYNIKELLHIAFAEKVVIPREIENLPLPHVLLVENIGILPPYFYPYLNLGWELASFLASYDLAYFIGNVTNEEIQKRTVNFREALEEADRLHLGALEIEKIFKKYHIRPDKEYDEIANNFYNFRARMGTSKSILSVRREVNKAVYYFRFNKEYDILGGYNPRNLSELEQRFLEHPHLREQALARYTDFVFSKLLHIPRERYIVGMDDFKGGGNINIYRKKLEGSTMDFIITPEDIQAILAQTKLFLYHIPKATD